MLILLSGCANRPNTAEHNIHINLNNIPTLKLDGLMELISYCKLGSNQNHNVIIDKIWRILISRDKVYVIYRYAGNNNDVELGIYTKSGEELEFISINHTGPEAITNLQDAWVYQENLEILDYSKQAIFEYDEANNKFRKIWDTPAGFSKAQRLTDEVYVFDADNNPTEIAGPRNLALINMKDNQIVSISDSIYQFHLGIGVMGKRFSMDENFAFYYPPVGMEIFKITPSAITPFAAIHSSINFQTESKSLSQEKFLYIRRLQQYLIGFDRFYKHGHLGLAQFRQQQKFYWLLINFKNGEFELIKPEFSVIQDMRISYQPVGMDSEGQLYLLLYSPDVYNFLSNTNNDDLKQDILQDINGIEMEDNPLLMDLSLAELYSHVRTL